MMNIYKNLLEVDAKIDLGNPTIVKFSCVVLSNDQD